MPHLTPQRAAYSAVHGASPFANSPSAEIPPHPSQQPPPPSAPLLSWQTGYRVRVTRQHQATPRTAATMPYVGRGVQSAGSSLLVELALVHRRVVAEVWDGSKVY
eukprot:gene12710-biopygen5217